MSAVFFWSFFGLVAWCYAGYPALMMLRARLRTRPIVPDRATPTLSVVLAVRNEAPRIVARIEDLARQAYPADRVEIVVVCNGCTDGTEARAAEATVGDARILVLESPAAEGKAGALNRGVNAASGEVIVFADARQTFEPDVFRILASRLADPSAGAVSGRLVIGDASDAAVSGIRRYWRVEVALRRAESETGSVVGATGAIYAIRRALYTPLPPGVILDDVLTPVRIALGGHRVLFAHEAVAHDRPTADAKGEFRRKVRTMVGNIEILRLEPRILSPRRNPIFWRYLSHKLLRLATPLCLIGMLLSGWLAGGIYGWIVLAQLAFYLLGGLGLLLPIPGLGFPAGFLLAHGAVLAALLRPTRGAAAVWTSSES